MHDSRPLHQLLQLHQQCGIPLLLSVQLICKWKCIGVAELTDSGGYHRNYLSATLRGAQKPSSQFREHVANVLGIDPWVFQSDIGGDHE